MTDIKDNLEVDLERISILYENTRLGYLGIGAATTFFGYVVWKLSSFNIAVIWMSVVAITYIPRICLTISFARKIKIDQIDKYNAKKWENYFFVASIIPFICFSAAVFIPYGESSFDGVLYYGVIVMTLLCGAILAYSTSLSVLFLFMNVSLLPLIVKCFSMQEPMFYALGSTLIFGYLLLSALIPRQHKLLLENITLKIENQIHSLTDPLTKLGNRRRLRLHIDDLLPLTIRHGKPFSIILLDIDNFKQYNDSFGHGAGDDLLVQVAQILLECSRDQDLVVRYGGEEFLLVLPATSIEAAIVLTERIQQAMKESTEVTFSAGLAMHSPDVDFKTLVKKADAGLYRAKEQGRNRYILAE